MSSWRRVPSQKRAPATLVIEPVENSDFFTNCSSRLEQILTYYNGITRPPTTIDSSQQFGLYKPTDYPPEKSIIERFFLEKVNGKISYFHPIAFKQSDQFTDYRKLPFKDILPFVRRYFTPSEAVNILAEGLQKKHAIKADNTCVLFYQGRTTETTLPPYDDYIIRAREILARAPKTQFLIQSNETEFIQAMRADLPNAVYFQSDTSVDLVNQDALQFLASMVIMSRCREIVFSSGNCSMWLLFFRGLTDKDSLLEGIQQYLDGNWLNGPLATVGVRRLPA